MPPIKNYTQVLMLTLAITSRICAPAMATEPDTKSIPKPILMLGLFCNSTLGALKTKFEANPSAPPWRSMGSKQEAIRALLQKLDTSDAAYEKAVRDQAITPGEAKFIKFSAVHEAEQWLNNINQSCASPDLPSADYESCLKETNSEIYKCYHQVIDAAQSMSKSLPVR